MEFKIIVFSFCLLLIVSVTSFWTYTMDLDEAHQEVRLARQELEAVQLGLQTAKDWLHARKEAIAFMTAAAIIDHQNHEMRLVLEKENQNQQNVAKTFLAAIERARRETLGVIMAELHLTNGLIFRQARLQSMDPELTVISHEDGVSKVKTSALPESLLDKLRLGFKPENADASPEAISRVPAIALISQAEKSLTGSVDTSASDSLARLGLKDDGKAPSPPPSDGRLVRPLKRDPYRIRIDGDPALWQNVEKTSVGRAYIRGQGWLRIGKDGPIPGTGRK